MRTTVRTRENMEKEIAELAAQVGKEFVSWPQQKLGAMSLEPDGHGRYIIIEYRENDRYPDFLVAWYPYGYLAINPQDSWILHQFGIIHGERVRLNERERAWKEAVRAARHLKG